jgi:CelD/BcsL family acetyltransferase involved in cellulose biosynthesis
MNPQAHPDGSLPEEPRTLAAAHDPANSEPTWRWDTLAHMDALWAIEPEWKALVGPRRFCVGPTWALTSLEQGAPRSRPVVFTARDSADRLVGVAPFRMVRATLSFPGQEAGADHLDVVAHPVHGLDFAKGVLRRFAEGPWKRLKLRHVADDAWIRQALREPAWWRSSVERAASVAPWIETSGTFDAWLQRAFGKKQRHEARRVVRRFREQPRARVERVSRPEEVEVALDVLLKLHERSFVAQGRATVFKGRVVRDFHLTLARRAAAEGSLWLATLRLDEEPLACFYGFRSPGTLHHFQSGIDPTRRPFGPGTLLRWITLEEDVFGAGLTAYDFMDGDEPYKFEWTDRSRTLFDIVVEKPILGGRLRTVVRRCFERGRSQLRAVLRRRTGVQD